MTEQSRGIGTGVRMNVFECYKLYSKLLTLTQLCLESSHILAVYNIQKELQDD